MGKRMDRRTCLASIGGTSTVALAGCTGGSMATRASLEVDRPDGEDTTCPEVEVLDEQEVLAPGLSPIGDSAVAWPVELVAGDVLKIAIYWHGESNRVVSLPDFTILDPTGSPLLELSDYSSNIHRVTTERDGTHEFQLRNKYLTEGGRWKLEVTWYDDVDCS